jgi:hypothetical protein
LFYPRPTSLIKGEINDMLLLFARLEAPLSYLSHGGERRLSLAGKKRNVKTLLTSLLQREVYISTIFTTT